MKSMIRQIVFTNNDAVFISICFSHFQGFYLVGNRFVVECPLVKIITHAVECSDFPNAVFDLIGKFHGFLRPVQISGICTKSRIHTSVNQEFHPNAILLWMLL